ncbi:hypothetical protein [Clostridium sp. JN-9]|uniref:hypothetical protein n=1 Tax=Clostridium sp. JN-9 TaxID=2507159 RepID=UPI000FFE2C4A|nr:hypothetical protein [Clostridium sp. JN-9]QAT38971.1 hypothetical protein EQM05_01110 [Clostridium sp. JN-9]
MNINKAIRKQKRSYKRFMLSMCFIFLLLPIVLLVLKSFKIFYIVYLIIIQLLILAAMLIRSNNETLKFEYNNYRLKINQGKMRQELNILCEKVVYVHTESIEDEEDFNIYLICSSKFRSKRLFPISLNFLKNHPYISYYYSKIKKQYPEKQYYYTVIKSGRLIKYALLDAIYKSCVYAEYSEDAIEKIKRYREDSYKK